LTDNFSVTKINEKRLNVKLEMLAYRYSEAIPSQHSVCYKTLSHSVHPLSCAARPHPT